MVRGFALCSVCKQITLRFWNVYGYCDRSDGGCNFGGIAQWAAGTINDGEMCGNCRAAHATRAAQAAKTARRQRETMHADNVLPESLAQVVEGPGDM